MNRQVCIYKLKLTKYEIRVAINALNCYRLKQKDRGRDCSSISTLILQLLDALEA